METVLYSCIKKVHIKRAVGLEMRRIISIPGSQMQYDKKTWIDSNLPLNQYALCSLFRSSETKVSTEGRKTEQCSAALQAPMVDIGWRFVDHDWRLENFPVATLNLSVVENQSVVIK